MQKILFVKIFTANILILLAYPKPNPQKKYLIEVGNSTFDDMEKGFGEVKNFDVFKVPRIEVVEGGDYSSNKARCECACACVSYCGDSSSDEVDKGLGEVSDPDVITVPRIADVEGGDYSRKRTCACACKCLIYCGDSDEKEDTNNCFIGC